MNAVEKIDQAPACCALGGAVGARSAGQVLADYVALTKPGVMTLLLVSTVCPMLVASRGGATFWLMVTALVGGALVTGSAATLNCVLDRDIDALMKRTCQRPIPANRISIHGALVFSSVLLLAGLWLLWKFLNPLAAGVALFGHLFYVIVYTVWLKRITPQNIVIGGAAGAVPPIVGWVGVRGEIDLTAICYFLVVFLWTPPHFWALAINKNEDYRRASVPMMPVIAGVRATVYQMWWYAFALLPVSLALVWVADELSWFAGTTLALIGAFFFWKIHLLWTIHRAGEPSVSEERQTRAAWDVFGFSVIYLALFFFFTVLDGTVL